ncbi:MAG: carboxypeptidase-like regulatory domain-containing protein, partial [Flavobacterium sp.]|nr:carboxypeptidase-like regulatory domain-containing protein [Flavobacterium sp.]
HITIPKPCSENWSKMSLVEQGRFCQSCRKKVFDFTQSSDREIADAFKSNASLCGRFHNSQLNRDLVVPKEKSSIWMATTSAIISFLAIGTEEISAQEHPKVVQTDKRVLLGEPAVVAENKEIIISGTISDTIGTLPGTSVSIKNSSVNVHSDMDGNYSIKAKENDTLVFVFIGMISEEVVVSKTCNLDINLKNDPSFAEQMVIVGGIQLKKRTFFGKIFHSIGRLFQ